MFIKCRHMFILPVIAILIAMTVSCNPDWKDEMMPDNFPETNGGSIPDRDIQTDTRKVMILYSAGFNSISNYLKEDIEDLGKGWLPRERRGDDVILVYSHQPAKRGQYVEMTEPVLFRIYSQSDGTMVRDTLMTYEAGTISASAGQFNNVLTYVKDHFPAKSYGLLFSSHATGYLPSGFYTNPSGYTFSEGMLHSMSMTGIRNPSPVPYIELEQSPDLPAVKSIGQDVHGKLSYEMDIRDFADAIPMKFDYILFDACLMGGIEVAYELAGKCDKVGFSQAEVLAEGFNYTTLASHLLGNKAQSDPYEVCYDYFIQYDNQTGVNRSATISLIDCNSLEDLAHVCKELFAKYSDRISSMNAAGVQRFYRASHHWFYDLASILQNAGMDNAEENRLNAALDKCVLYKGATPSFMGEFSINTFSGFSMYLPSNGNTELNKYYKTLKWNQATGLVK